MPMDPALRLLWRLRLRAFFRRWGKSLRTGKGIALTLVGLLMFVPWLWSIAMVPPDVGGIDPASLRRFGPLILLAYATLSLITSTGGSALFFTPAEVAFLFPGPFTRRGLLVYKLAGMVFGVLFSSVFFLLVLLRSSRNFLSAYVAIVLAMLFLQLLAMAVGLASDTVAVMATSVRRRLVLGLLVVLAVSAAWSAGTEALRLPAPEVLKKVEASPGIRAATMPFRPFILAYTAERVWPDLAGWSAVCLAMLGGLLVAVFAIDAQYLESSAASSARVYEQIQRMRRGGGVAFRRNSKTTSKVRLRMLPWCAGVGPVLWRQLATAARAPIRLTLITLVIMGPGLAMIYAHRGAPERIRAAIYTFPGASLYFSCFFSAMVAFDFRGDVDRMAEIKSLPISSLSVVVGQMLTPFLIFTLPVLLGVLLALPRLGGIDLESVATLAITMPISFLMIGLENLLVLIFPARTNTANPADFTAIGRQILLLLAKFLGGGLMIGVSVLVGVGAFYILGASRPVAVLVTLAVATSLASLLVPLQVVAFDRYDVASDAPA
jgi:hypothetical protein